MLPDSPATEININLSLDDSDSDLEEQPMGKKRAANDDVVALGQPKKRFVAAKGQKMAAKRLQKLKSIYFNITFIGIDVLYSTNIVLFY